MTHPHDYTPEAEQVGRDLATTSPNPSLTAPAFRLADALTVCSIPINAATMRAASQGWESVVAKL